MLSGISWNNYIIVVVLLSVVWYLFVGLYYYFDTIKDVITGKRKLQFRSLAEKSISKKDYDFDDHLSEEVLNAPVTFEPVDPDFNMVEDLTAKLKITISDAHQKKLIKSEFEVRLQILLTEYASLGSSPFRPSINEFIVGECEKQDSVLLTHQEVDSLWN
ncbi:hypothetical protein ABS764_02560 [Flavobacterium sp. ST-87]|uniref:Uncharacterized protein n=1 Tax=Flavobacterium plantiphilum TaxID=3163297 RepID=A0ABW8XQB0_9FLAO